jgi:hypothetical protein
MSAYRISPAPILAATFCLIFGLGMIFLVNPQLSQITASQQKINDLSASISASRTVTAPKPSDAVVAKYQEVTDLLPMSDQEYDLAVQVEALTKSLGLPLSSLNMSLGQAGTATSAGAAVPASLSGVNIAMTTKGSYPAVEQLVSGLSTLNRYIQVSQVLVNTLVGDSTQVTAQIVAVAYFMPLAAPAATK